MQSYFQRTFKLVWKRHETGSITEMMPQIISADILGAEVEPCELRMFLKHPSAKGMVMHGVWVFQV